MKEYIENVLASRLQGDGGWVEFVSLEGEADTLRVKPFEIITVGIPPQEE